MSCPPPASCPAKAGHPVRRDVNDWTEISQRTGSSAFADDDSEDGVAGCLFITSRRMCLVGGLIHQAAEFALVRDLELEEPRLAAGVGIHQRGLGGERFVD